MKTKLGLIVLIIIIGLCSISNLLAFKSDYKKKQPISGELVDKIFKRFEKDYGSDAQEGKKRIGFKVYEADEPKYKDYKTYIAFWGPYRTPYKPRRHIIFFVKKEKIFMMGRDFNYLLKNEHIKIDSTNQLEIVKLFFRLTDYKYYKILKIEKSNKFYIEDYKSEYGNLYEKYKDKIKMIKYQLEITLKATRGETIRCSFYFEKGEIKVIRYEKLYRESGRAIGANEKVWHYVPYTTSFYRNKNIEVFSCESKLSFEDSEPDTVFCYLKNVKLKQDSVYEPTSATVTVRLSGFPSNESTLIWFKSISEDGTVKYYPENPILFTTNFWGNAEQDITFPDTLFTGKYKVYQVGNEYETERYFFIYETITSPLPNTTNYNSRIFFCDQFKDFNHNAINNLAENIKLKFNDVFNTEINNWNFLSPKDIDPDENLDIYVIDAHYDNCIPKVFL